MKRFEQCTDCKNKMNDDYCLYCQHHYHLHRMKLKDLRDLKDFYMKDNNTIIMETLE